MNSISFTSYLIICPLVFIAGFIDAIAGGGGLIALPAYMIAGLPPHNAIATNKLSSTLGTAAATVKYAKDGYIPWKLSLCCALMAIGGSEIGASLSLLLDDYVLSILMLFLVPVTAVLVLRKRSLDDDYRPLNMKLTYLIALSVAFVLGMYDGFYGPGTGTFLILLLTAAAHMKLTTANGVTKAINLSSNITAATVYFLNGKVFLSLGLVAGLFSMAGNWLGSKIFSAKGVKAVKPVMLIVLLVFVFKIITELLQA